MTYKQYTDISLALRNVALALSALHDPLYVSGLLHEPGWHKMGTGLSELRARLVELRPVDPSSEDVTVEDEP